jgi:hypothetical protein
MLLNANKSIDKFVFHFLNFQQQQQQQQQNVKLTDKYIFICFKYHS